jgi:hypothetical protein
MRAPYRDRDGLTFPTSSAEQIATPGRSLCSLRRRRLPESKICLFHPHSMHDDRQLSGNRDACLLRAGAFGELHTPRPNRRPLLESPQVRIRRFKERVPHGFVPALANVAGAINLTRLINARRQPEVCRHGLTGCALRLILKAQSSCLRFSLTPRRFERGISNAIRSRQGDASPRA